MAGLACAHYLRHTGHRITLFEKGRKVGGRCGARRTRDATFDHGAQYFTARSMAFKPVVEGLGRSGAVARWTPIIGTLAHGRFTPEQDGPDRYVGTPTMGDLARALGHGSEIRSRTRITTVHRDANGWILQADGGARWGPFEQVAIAVPAPEAATLLAPVPHLAAQAASVVMTPCWATMLVPQTTIPVNFDAAFVPNSDVLSWVCRQSTKPGRSPAFAWVLHATTDWSAAQMNEPAETVAGAMVRAFGAALEAALPPASHITAHLWEHADVPTPFPDSHLLDPTAGVGACGDWCAGPRVEDAFLSGMSLAHAIGPTQ